MAILRSQTIEPSTGTTLTLGASGDAVTSSSDMIKANTFKDAGGNTLWTSNGSGTLSNINSALAGGGLVKISTSSTIDVNNIDFTSGIDSTYDEYMLVWTGIGSQTDGVYLYFQGSTDGGSTWGVTWTTTYYFAYNLNNGTSNSINYDVNEDNANNTSFVALAHILGYEAFESTNGYVHIFNPSSTTFQKHWYSRAASNSNHSGESTFDTFVAGYWNTTSAINAVQFKMSSGNIDGGEITLYGVA
jgi:hypothetical protein